MEEFFEKGQKRKTEPRIELLLCEINSVVSGFLCGHGVPIHQLNGDAIQKIEVVMKLSLVQDFSGLPWIGASESTLPTRSSPVG